eukprot:8069802-Pyramimonas_sp.AAC.1
MLARGQHLDGEPAAEDPDGTIWKFALLFGKGDMGQLMRWGHRSYNASVSVCSGCDCDRDEKPSTS